MISHEIIGDDMQAVVMSMAAGDEIRAEAGAMTYMTGGIEMEARMQGGLLGGLTRKFLAGETLFLTFFRCTTPTGTVAFSAPYPGKIVRMPLQGSAMLCQRGSFLCAAGDINISVAFTKKLGAGFFGGEGLFFALMTGPGRVWVQTLPFSRLADRVLSAFHGGKEEVRRGDLGGALGAIGDLISGDG
jgi:uncharacterized protein (AIM24 family)